MKRPARFWLVLLPLVVVLLFGNCGGGVYGFINGLGPDRRARLNDAIAQRLVLRKAARQRLHGRARHNELRRIEALTDARIDSLRFSDFEESKFAHRRSKIERRLRQQGL
jgi:hypothetical protein